MPSFLVETFAPRRSPAALAELTAQARAATDVASKEGLRVRHVRSFLAPDDEICFHLFEAPSADVVASMSQLAGLDHERITEVIE